MAHEGDPSPKRSVARRILTGAGLVGLAAAVIGPFGFGTIGELIDPRDATVWQQGLIGNLRPIKINWLKDIIVEPSDHVPSFIGNGTATPDHRDWGQAVFLHGDAYELNAGIDKGGYEALALMDANSNGWRVGTPAVNQEFTRAGDAIDVALSLNPAGVTAGIGYIMRNRFIGVHTIGAGPLDLNSLNPESKDPLAFVSY